MLTMITSILTFIQSLDLFSITIIVGGGIYTLLFIFGLICIIQFNLYLLKFRRRVNKLYPNSFKFNLWSPALIKDGINSKVVSFNPLTAFSWTKMEKSLFLGVNDNARTDSLVTEYCNQIKKYHRLYMYTWLILFLLTTSIYLFSL